MGYLDPLYNETDAVHVSERKPLGASSGCQYIISLNGTNSVDFKAVHSRVLLLSIPIQIRRLDHENYSKKSSLRSHFT